MCISDLQKFCCSRIIDSRVEGYPYSIIYGRIYVYYVICDKAVVVSSNKKKKLLKCTTGLAAIIHKWMRFQFFRVRVGRDRRAAVSCCTQLANDRITHVTTTCTAVFWSRNLSGNETACGGFRHDVIISKNSCTTSFV